MSTQVRLRHLSSYAYDRPVLLGPQEIRLCPATHGPTEISDYSMRVTPHDGFLHWQTDSVNNRLARLVVPYEIEHLQIDVTLTALLQPHNPFDFFVDQAAESYPFEYSHRTELLAYLLVDELGPRFTEFTSSLSQQPKTIDCVVGVNQQVHRAIRYEVREQAGVQTCEESLLLGRGSCRDMTWLLVQSLRHMGLATRCVSGYLVQLKNVERDCDSVDYHAWAEVLIPGAGWIGLDPTSGMLAGTGHLPLAMGPAPSHVSAVTGTHSHAELTLACSLGLIRLNESETPPRSRKVGDLPAIQTVHACELELGPSSSRVTKLEHAVACQKSG